MLGLLGVASFIGECYAVTWLWQWFAVPLGVPGITLWHAAGLDALVRVFAYRYSKSRWDKLSFDEQADIVFAHFGHWLTAWGLGWLLSFGVAR